MLTTAEIGAALAHFEPRLHEGTHAPGGVADHVRLISRLYQPVHGGRGDQPALVEARPEHFLDACASRVGELRLAGGRPVPMRDGEYPFDLLFTSSHFGVERILAMLCWVPEDHMHVRVPEGAPDSDRTAFGNAISDAHRYMLACYIDGQLRTGLTYSRLVNLLKHMPAGFAADPHRSGVTYHRRLYAYRIFGLLCFDAREPWQTDRPVLPPTTRRRGATGAPARPNFGHRSP